MKEIAAQILAALARLFKRRNEDFAALSEAWQKFAEEIRAQYQSLDARMSRCEEDRERLYEEIRQLKGIP
jgi:hypothetical protein